MKRWVEYYLKLYSRGNAVVASALNAIDCNNYRGISLLTTIVKLYARVVLVRLQNLAQHVFFM